MDRTIFHVQDPAPARLIALIVFIVLAIVFIVFWVPVYALLPVACAGVLVFMSVRHPEQYFALQQDRITAETYARYNRFIDALVSANIIDENTTQQDLTVLEVSPYVYTVEMRQQGKTGDMLRRACETSLNAMEALAVDVKQDSASSYTVRYSARDPREILSDMSAPYRELMDPEISIAHLPVGKYQDETPVYMRLDSRNALINGNPRSGKSVLLSVLLCNLCRVNHPIITICMSPKALDFQDFEPAVKLISDPVAMLEYLSKIHDESERRKRYCMEHHIKKIEPQHYQDCPPIVVIMDEFTVIKTSTREDDKGRPDRIGEKVENAVMRLVAETGFAAISFVLCTQRVSSQNMRTDLRDLIAGNRISFATETPESDRMIFGDYAEFAPCHEITTQQKGVGYISADGLKPVPFKGAFADSADEQEAQAIAYRKLQERKRQRHWNVRA